METFTILRGVPATLPEANISTDAIIPSVWAIKPGVDRGAKPFANWPYDENGSETPDFILNRPPFRNATILVSGANFGCGSSREAAVWALRRFGIRCVIAESFGEIFRENMYKNGMLPVALSSRALDRLSAFIADNQGVPIEIDPPSRMISVTPPCRFHSKFLKQDERC
jgi:3-isopropylmalate/(R)-2-methylmalate dehydratase small subunit